MLSEKKLEGNCHNMEERNMYEKTKTQILEGINGTNAWMQAEFVGPIQQQEIKLPTEMILKSVIDSLEGLKPGIDCLVSDYRVTPNSITLVINKGGVKKVRTIPNAVVDMFSKEQEDFDDFDE